jgi:hypothetical protein
MKRLLLIFTAVILLAVSAKGGYTNTFEYATIRWDGDNTYVILPSSKVDFVGKQLKAIKKPDRVDERSFYLNATMNSLGDKGYEFCGITGDGNTIVMKRQVTKQSDQK